MPRIRAAAAVAALALLAAPTAAHSKTLRGKTGQGHRVTLTLGADGVPTKFVIRWTVQCKNTKGRSRWTSDFVPKFDVATPDTLQDADTRRSRRKGGVRERARAELSGQRAGEQWSGTFNQRSVFAYKGRVFDVCDSKGITWSVS